jgi:hypothetical protein
MFPSKAKAYPIEALFRFSTQGKLLASPTNIKLGWKSLPRTNTQAYFENPLITTVKVLYYRPQGLSL